MWTLKGKYQNFCRILNSLEKETVRECMVQQ